MQQVLMLCLVVSLCYGTSQWGSPGAGVGMAGVAAPRAFLASPVAGLAAPSLIQEEQLPLWAVGRGGRLGGSSGTAETRRLPGSQVTIYLAYS